jgi:hypothetical protein
LQLKKHLLSHRKRALGAVLVGLMLHALLHTQQVVASRSNDELTFLQPSLDISWKDGARGSHTEVAGLATIDDLKG